MRLVEPTAVSRTELTPLNFLSRSAEVFPNKEAVVYGDLCWSYADFYAEALRIADALHNSGIKPGDRVAYFMYNVPQMLVANFAVPLVGAILVPCNTRLQSNEVAYILAHSQASMIVTDAALADMSVAAASMVTTCEEVVVWADPLHESGQLPLPTHERQKVSSYDDFRARGKVVERPFSVADENATISINYTSGTTGKPKGVVYTHRSTYLNATAELLHTTSSPATRYLWTLPMFHTNGWCYPWAITGIAGTHVCLREVRGEAIWSAFDNEGITLLCAAPTVLSIIVEAPECHQLEQPVRMVTAGAPPSPTIIEKMEGIGGEIIHVYGLTEVYGPYTVCDPHPEWKDLPAAERAEILSRQGWRMIGMEPARVVDEHMNDVPVDGQTIGEVVLRGNNVMAGYLDDPEGTDDAFRGGYFHSGDLGVMHADGSIQIKDRAKDIVISGGENISTVEVENCLMKHPAVLEVAVIGVPDERWGERTKAFVVTRPGKSVTDRQLIEHVRAELAHFKAPREVAIVTEIPKTSTGKIQKYTLRAQEAGTATS